MLVSIPRAKSIPPIESIDRDGAIRPLENGERLTRDEFMRRYEAMPDLKNAELIEGVVHVRSFDRLLDVLQHGLDSPEHAGFVTRSLGA